MSYYAPKKGNKLVIPSCSILFPLFGTVVAEKLPFVLSQPVEESKQRGLVVRRRVVHGACRQRVVEPKD